MKKILLFFSAITISSFVFSQAFVPGNLVISRYGDGVANWPTTTKTIPVFLDEYDLTGQKVRSLALPTSTNSGEDDDDSGNRILTGSAKVKDEGLITLSPNGQFLSMVGYNLAPYTTNYNNTTSRTIGIITSDGNIDTRTGARVVLGNPRCAITHNGANVWYVGSGSGLRRKTVGSAPKIDSIILNPPTGYNSVYIYNDQLYYTTDNAAGPKIARVGESLPFAEQQTSTALPGYPNTGSPDQIIMLDNNASTSEPDLMYVTDADAGSLQKWVFNGAQWVAQGEVTLPGVTDEIRGLTGEIVKGNVVLYAVTSTSLLKFNDAEAISSTFSAATHTPVVLAQAPAKTQFKGVAYTPGTVKEKRYVDVSSREFASLIQQKTNLIKELKTNVTYQRYPGVEETDITYTSNKGVPIAIYFLKVNLANPNISIEAATPYDKPDFKLQTVREMIHYKNAASSERQVVAASNGDYFKWPGVPDGVVIKNGTVIKESPANTYFFSIRNDGKALVGDKRIYEATVSTLKEAIGGRFYLMHYGEVMTEHLKDISVEPRSTVGILSPDKVVFMWVDGRRAGHSAGLSLTDMAYIYKAIGVTDAINLDGGGSSTFIMREKDGTYKTHNQPTDATGEREDANALVVMAKSSIAFSKSRPFSAQPVGHSVKLTWTTDSEGEYASYIIERSKDAKIFEATGIEMTQQGDSDAPVRFECFDNNPYAGVSYYRLRKISFDGNIVFSKTVTVSRDEDAASLVVYPNPVTTQVTLSLDVVNESQRLAFSLSDKDGNTVYTFTGSLTEINKELNRRLGNLHVGIYVVTITSGKNIYSTRFIKE